MVKKSKLRRGFKSDAERKASYFRKELDLNEYDPLCAFKLAKHLGIKVYPATHYIKEISRQHSLIKEWSALTMRTEKGDTIIIYNNFHSKSRIQSDLMHELAHIICGHIASEPKANEKIPFGLKSHNCEQEEEAQCLGATLQLPEAALIWTKRKGMNISEISEFYSASEQMVRFRINITGINKRMGYRH